MGSFIIKARPDEDLYVEWSTVVDNATWVGTRAEALTDRVDPERLDRADRTGTSALPDPHVPADFYATHGLTGAWDDSGFIVMNADTVPDPRWLPRERLADYARHLCADRVAEAEALTDPLPDEPQPGQGAAEPSRAER